MVFQRKEVRAGEHGNLELLTQWQTQKLVASTRNRDSVQNTFILTYGNTEMLKWDQLDGLRRSVLSMEAMAGQSALPYASHWPTSAWASELTHELAQV